MKITDIGGSLSRIFYGWRMIGLVSAIRVVGGISTALRFFSCRSARTSGSAARPLPSPSRSRAPKAPSKRRWSAT
jgi:hypothetical protein